MRGKIVAPKIAGALPAPMTAVYNKMQQQQYLINI